MRTVVIGVYNSDNYDTYREAEKDGATYLTETIEASKESILSAVKGIRVANWCINDDINQLNIQVIDDDAEFDVKEYLDIHFWEEK